MRDQKLLGHAKQMRREPTPAEYRLWLSLKAGRLSGAKFRHQQVIGPYVADFACRLPAKMIVEADGHSHGLPGQQARDADRTLYFEAKGYTVLRFTNADIMNNLDGVLVTIQNAFQPPLPSPLP